MLNEIYFEKSMDEDFVSDSIEIIKNDLTNLRLQQSADSLQIFWNECQGYFDGIIEIYASNDNENWAKATELNIDSISNSNDSMIYLIDPYIQFLKIKYYQNGLISGKLSVYLNFKGV